MSSSETRSKEANPDLPPEQHDVWRSLLAVATRGLERVDQNLQRQSNMTLTDYEILSALAATDESRLRMSELAERVYVSRSRLTYRVDRLTEVGFVVREECEDDRRGLWAILTETGRTQAENAARDHHAFVKTLIFDHIAADELSTLSTTLHTIVQKLDLD